MRKEARRGWLFVGLASSLASIACFPGWLEAG